MSLAAAAGAGISVVYTPSANAGAGPEHAVLIMLALVKRFVIAAHGICVGGCSMMEIVGVV